jgi:hypothetical protein
MKSYNIRRLEFISDKIEGGDSKREVICIRFVYPTKKKGDCVRLSMGGQSWPELGLHDRPWECSLERGERGKERGKGGHG